MPGKAAANGVLAALLVERGFAASERVFEAPRGLFNVLARDHREEFLADGWGEDWELFGTTVKPYPCDSLCHPVIEAALALVARVPHTNRIRRVKVRCNPLVVDLASTQQPDDGLETHFSAAHAIAVALVERRVTLQQFDDAHARDQRLRRLRGVIELDPDPDCPRDGASLSVELDDSNVFLRCKTHAREPGPTAHNSGAARKGAWAR